VPTALSGSLGWSAIHPVQLGGPPLISTWSRPLPTKALPLIAHVYANDGVTFIGSFAPLNRPVLKATTANGGYDAITLEVASRGDGMLWGRFVWGSTVWGASGLNVSQGNVIRLTEQGGPWNGFLYSGMVEGFPDVRSSRGVSHQVAVTPFAAELLRVSTQLVYTAPVDIVQAVRAAVALTQHCSCDQVSVPVSTGIPLVSTSGGAVDFRGQKVNQVLDTCRSIAGPAWYWYCDELGRVWFQPRASAAAYTVMGGAHYEERVSNGGDISDRINQVPAVGGVPDGGSANVQVTVNGSSQAALGLRTLDPPLQVPGITDLATLTAVATGILGTLDQTWERCALKLLPTLGQRIHGSQPGGAVLRYWEPAVNALPESAGGTGGYTGPFIVQSVEYDGLYQQVEAGSAPVTNQADVDNMVRSLLNRTAAVAFVNTAASLNLNQTLTGSFQSSPGTVTPTHLRATLWVLNQNEFAAIDPNGVERVQQGNLTALGGSTAGWKIRANDATGSPVFDSDQVFGDRVMKNLGIATAGSQSFTSTTFAQITGATLSFSVPRTCNLYAPFLCTGRVNTNNGNVGFVRAILDGVTTSGNQNFGVLANFAQTSAGWIFVTGLAAGSYTLRLEAAVNATPQTFDAIESAVQAFQLGG
jgi:hypothetical protein